MTIRQAIDRLDARMANTFTNADKIAWLTTADSIINAKIMNAGSCEYTEEDIDTFLLAPAPFDEMYIYYMEAMIHYYNGENDRYNATTIMYNKHFEDFAAWYVRTNNPTKKPVRFVF